MLFAPRLGGCLLCRWEAVGAEAGVVGFGNEGNTATFTRLGNKPLAAVSPDTLFFVVLTLDCLTAGRTVSRHIRAGQIHLAAADTSLFLNVAIPL